jgi:hypothetical protein
MYLLNDLPAAQEALWEMLVSRAVELLPLGLGDLPRICELLRKYAERPMDLADAALYPDCRARRYPENIHCGQERLLSL